MGYNMNGFSGFGNSTMKKEDERAGKTSTEQDDPSSVNRKIYGFDSYKEGEWVDESDLESKFSQTGDDPKDYPQYSVQDYSKVRKDEKGNYVVRLQD